MEKDDWVDESSLKYTAIFLTYACYPILPDFAADERCFVWLSLVHQGPLHLGNSLVLWKSPFSASKLLQYCNLPTGHASDHLNTIQSSFLIHTVSFNCLSNAISILAPLVSAGTFRSNMLVINTFITVTVEDTNVYFTNIKYLSFMSFQRNIQKPIYVRGTLLCSCENLMGNIRLPWERFRTDFYFSGLKSLFKRKKDGWVL